MFKKFVIICALLSVFSAIAVAQIKDQTRIYDIDDENYMWYEFKIRQFKKPFKFFAFKTDEQRNNRTVQLFKSQGWGMGPHETITEFYNFNAGEKTKLWDEELKPVMKKEGYKYAFTTYKSTNEDNTTVYLYTFYYDKDHDDLYMLKSYK
ncbi:MAG: hypothetical protein IJ530_02575 [Treponema sp.]|uniref:hypothetical protein n=1 Tax=Treponema sp. TaxID=166 RepID=UPI0025EBEC2B|nr:hypothetical protein [Treponema sp.]MBQ8678626.1 hypothetical protein [Treponema sp.]MBR1403764.1 hypothetical protein [Treponema sp.]